MVLESGCVRRPRAGSGAVHWRTRISPADPANFRNLRDYTDWKNRYLIVKPNGISLLHSTPPERLAALESVPAILEGLPKSAWPYGLIVVVQEPGLLGMNDTPRVDANRDKLLRLLKAMGVSVSMWPSA